MEIIEVKGNPGQGNTYSESTVHQAGNVFPNATTVNIGMTDTEVRALVDKLVKSKLALYQQDAAEETLRRKMVIIDQLIERLKQLDSALRQRFQEPAIQFAVSETTTEYIRSGKEELSDDLIDLMIERLKVEEHSTQQAIIDDARHILPKLSNSAVAILAMLAFVKIILIRQRSQFIDCLRKLSPLLSQLEDLHSLDIAYLEQARCGHSQPAITYNQSFVASMKRTYDVFFTHPITADTYNRVLAENHLNTVVDIHAHVATMSLFAFKGELLQYNLSTKADDRSIKGPFKDHVIACYNALRPHFKPYTDNEIRQFFLDIDPNWQAAFNLFERSDIRTLLLDPVGVYIGTRKLTHLLGEDVPLGIYYED